MPVAAMEPPAPGPNQPAQNQMGLFSRDRLTEATLREIYQYLFVDLGVRVPVSGVLTRTRTVEGHSTHTLAVTNEGAAGKGLVAEALTFALVVPDGANVISTTGVGYKGLRRDSALAGGAQVAVWELPKIAAGEKRTYTITMSGDIPSTALKGSIVTWAKPALGPGAASRADSVSIALK